MDFNAKDFWEKRFEKTLDLCTTGHRAFDYSYNKLLYQSQVDTIVQAIEKYEINTQGASLLDIGTGSGFFISLFRELGSHPIFGIDITEASILHLQNTYPDSSFARVDISSENLPFNRQFDLIIAMSVMFHIVSPQKFEQAVRNICNALNDKGFILICDSFGHMNLPSPKHVRMRSLEAYRPILEEMNVEVSGILPMYFLMNKTFFPVLGPWLVKKLSLGNVFYKIDRWLKSKGLRKFSGMKLLVARKVNIS